MTLPDDPRLLLQAAGFCIGAALFWLGAEIGVVRQSSRRRKLHFGSKTAGLLLLACAWWWPGHFVSGRVPDFSGNDALRQLGWPLALVVLGRATAALATRRTAVAFVALALTTAVVAYMHAMTSAPGLFHIAPSAVLLVSGTAVVLMSWAAISVHVAGKATVRRRVLRGAAALVAPALLVFGAEASVPSERSLFWAEPAALLAIASVAGMLLIALKALAEMPSRKAHERDAAAAQPGKTLEAVDGLTQLPTRVHFERRLASAARRCDDKNHRLALLFIDLDGFKPVNDTWGHNVGDMVLEQVGQRLKAMSRGKDIVARIGGDEFLLLLPMVGTDEGVAQVAKRLIDGLSQTYAVEQRDVHISCSVGIAFYPDGCSRDKLIARADAAMYEAKRAGGSTHCFYSPSMDADAQEGFELVSDLRKALTSDELELYYQPKIDAKSGKVTAAEALLRWNHPTRGQIQPGVFIPLAERSGLISALGNWVIEDACRQGRVWREQGLRMRVAINLSAQQMRRDDIVDHIAGALERHRIHPSLLTCEITESVAMEDTKATQETFRRLGALGAHLSIDDFGTGYSSLGYLRKLPAEELKIDQSFVMDIEHSADARAIVDAVTRLAHALGLKVVAEGVENTRQQEILVELGCDELQGYLFAKPMSSRALLLWALDDRPATAAFKPSLFGETKQAVRA